MSLAAKVFGSTIVQIGGKMVTAVLSIITIKLLTTYLGDRGYGMYTTVYELLSLAAVLGDFGIFQVAVRDMAAGKRRVEDILADALTLRLLLLGIVLTIFSTSVFFIHQYAGTLIPVGVLVGTAFVLLNLMSGTLSSVLQFRLDMGKAVLFQIAGKFASLLYILATLLWFFPADTTQGFYHVLLAGAVGIACTLLGIAYEVSRVARIHLTFSLSRIWTLLRRAAPYGIAVILGAIYFRMDTLLLGLLLPAADTAAAARELAQTQVGLYGVAVRIVENLQMVPQFFMNAMLSVFAAFLAVSREKFRTAFQSGFDVLVLIALPIAAGGIVLAYPLVSLIADSAFLSTASSYGTDAVLAVLLVAMGFSFVSSLMSFSLLAAERGKDLLIVNIAVVLVKGALTLTLIPLYRHMGAVTASALSEILLCIVLSIVVWRRIGVLPRFTVLMKALFAALIMGGVVYALHTGLKDMGNSMLLIAVPIGGLVYGGLIFLLRAVTPDMLRILLKKRPPAQIGEI